MTSQRYPLMERVSDLKTGLPAKVTVTGAPLRQQVRTSRKRQSSFRASVSHIHNLATEIFLKLLCIIELCALLDSFYTNTTSSEIASHNCNPEHIIGIISNPHCLN
jgi:hypothetical protein